MNHAEQICRKPTLVSLFVLSMMLLSTARVWSQTDNQTANPPAQPVPAMVGLDRSATPADITNDAFPDDRMRIPPPVSGQAFPAMPSSEEHFNYLRYGLSFTSAYTDNALGPLLGHPVSEVSYSVAPLVALDDSTSRAHLLLTYAPGFTFYQRTSELNQADQNAAITLQYRLSPHVTVDARDAFQKSSNVFNQPDLASAGTVSGGTEGPNGSVIAPIADRLGNAGNADITYQFGRNSMIGAGATFFNLHYPNPSQVPGLYDTESQAGSAFYAFRIGHSYLGATYQYQRLVSYPTASVGETQTHAGLLFYSFYPTSRLSVSFFGGPQYARTVQPPLPPSQVPLPVLRQWMPTGGASVNWQGRFSSFAVAYSHLVTGGGGLTQAVRMDSATAMARQQMTRTLSAWLTGGYVQNDVLDTLVQEGYGGHSIFGTASLQQQLGEHLNLQVGYTRLRQDYSNVAVLSSTPNTNREFVSVSYQFSRPLGR